MCRLAYITKRFQGLTKWLRKLEHSFGGDGNGVAIANKHCKGQKLKITDTAKIIAEHTLPALFHTRKCSAGAICDELCHPFPCGGGWLVHNGHWSDGVYMGAGFRDAGFLKGEFSDTLVFSMLVENLGFVAAVERWKPTGVWLWMSFAGELWVWKKGGELCYCPSQGCWGSEPSKGYGWYDVKDGLYLPGAVPEREPPRPKWVPFQQYGWERKEYKPLSESEKLAQQNGYGWHPA